MFTVFSNNLFTSTRSIYYTAITFFAKFVYQNCLTLSLVTLICLKKVFFSVYFSTNPFSNTTFYSTMFKLKHLFLFLATRSIFLLFFLKINPFQYENFIKDSTSKYSLSIIIFYNYYNQIFSIVFHAYFYPLLILFLSSIVTNNSFYIEEARWLTLWRFIDRGSYIALLMKQRALSSRNANAALIIHVYRSIAIMQTGSFIYRIYAAHRSPRSDYCLFAQ